VSDQNDTQVSTKRRSSHPAKNKKNEGQELSLSRPTNNDVWAWRDFWVHEGQPWRREIEIDAERQKYLEEFRSRRKVYWNDSKLSRADIEWLLATHNNGHGHIDWGDTSQRQLRGLNLCGANLSHQDLSYLPLANMIGNEDMNLPVNLAGAKLSHAHFEGAQLSKVNLSNSSLEDSHLEGADLTLADLHGANLSGVYFDGETKLNQIFLGNKDHDAASLVDIHWGEVNIAVVDWSSLSKLGNERIVRKSDMFRSQVRAYRQLSVVLRNQGFNDEANRFAYRAQLMQRKVYWRQKKLAQYLILSFSLSVSWIWLQALAQFFCLSHCHFIVRYSILYHWSHSRAVSNPFRFNSVQYDFVSWARLFPRRHHTG
jgi:hypothetical protein